MSICDSINAVMRMHQVTPHDQIICDRYIAANEYFEQLVSEGVVTKRGHQLLPVENIHSCTIEVNHSKTSN